MKKHNLFAFAWAGVAAFSLACSQSPSAPSSTNGGAPGGLNANADGSTLKVTAPAPVSPAGGIDVEDLSPDLVINNATTKFVQGLALSYVFEVVDDEGRVVYRSSPVPQGANGRTTHEVDLDLEGDVVHTWRAWAVHQSQRGPTSNAANFKTLNRFGVSCARPGATEVDIVACRFAQHGGGSGMDHEETIEFMREVAYDLNRMGFSDKGGFGILIKTTGNNCLGYSCDIICEGNGNDQNQYDILIDESIPNWAEVAEVTVRPCEIIR